MPRVAGSTWLVDPWTTATLDLDATLPGSITGAVVEIEGGGALVEQVALDADGNSVAPCANATSDQWYLADGFTVEGSLDQVILTKPVRTDGRRQPLVHHPRGLPRAGFVSRHHGAAAQHPSDRSRRAGRRCPE
ncbi:MAG: hypothetical protein R2697_21995 [Ilumatobacteraceae bacterium]